MHQVACIVDSSCKGPGGVKSRGLKRITWVLTDTLLLTYLNTLLVATMTTSVNFMVSSIDIQELASQNLLNCSVLCIALENQLRCPPAPKSLKKITIVWSVCGEGSNPWTVASWSVRVASRSHRGLPRGLIAGYLEVSCAFPSRSQGTNFETKFSIFWPFFLR